MPFKVLFLPKALDSFNCLDKGLREQIKKKLYKLHTNPESGKHLRHSNFWSIRVKNYRVIYEIKKSEKKVIVLFIGRRKNVYDDFSRLF